MPSGDYSGNVADAILIDPKYALAEDAVMRDRGVPYRIGDSNNDHFTIGSGVQGAPPTVLTIEPGVTLAFHPNTALRIESATGPFPATGALVAAGTAAKPIVFTSAASTPQPGDWVGLWFGGIVSEQTRISHSRIEYTGADCGCVLLTCNTLDGFEGALIMSQEPPGPFLQDSVIAHGSGHGVVLGYDGGPIEFSEGNDFDDIGGCDVTLPRLPMCPDPKPTCD